MAPSSVAASSIGAWAADVLALVGGGELVAGQTVGNEAALLRWLLGGAQRGDGFGGDAGDVVALLGGWLGPLADWRRRDERRQWAVLAPPWRQRIAAFGEVWEEPAQPGGVGE